jgi:hypothetical protein
VVPEALMTRTVWTAIIAVGVAGLGCTRDQIRRDRDPLSPTARASEPSPRKSTVAPASRLNGPDSARTAPTNLEDPAKLDADSETDRKTLPERIRERRDERKDNRTPEKPALPSAFQPKTEAPPPAPVPEAPNVEPPKAEPPKINSPSKSSELAQIKAIYTTAAAQFEKLVTFEAQMTRREVVKNREQPTEEVLFQYRKKPLSIYMRNLGDQGRGREVVYVDGQHDGKMHIIMGEGDGGIFAKPGTKLAFEPTNPLIAGRSRHKITEAGFGDSVTRFGKVIALTENGTRPGGVKSLGKVDRKEYAYPLEGVDITLMPSDDPLLPKGGRKLVYFDMKADSPSYGFPVVLITQDETGREVEYYAFTKFKNPANLTDADFDPARLVPKRR